MTKTLQAKLDSIRKGFEAQAPAEVLEIMHRATEDLRASGAPDRALGVGASAPSFALPDTEGKTVSSAGLLAGGPLVLAFFRGHW